MASIQSLIKINVSPRDTFGTLALSLKNAKRSIVPHKKIKYYE